MDAPMTPREAVAWLVENTDAARKTYCIILRSTNGVHNPGTRGMLICQAAELAGLFYYHMAFFSGDSLTENGDITFDGLDRMPVLQTAAGHAEKKVLLFSREQMNAEPGSGLLRLKDMNYVVTDIPGYFSSGYFRSGYPGTVIGAGA